MNNDLISRKALIEAYDKAHKGPPGGARKLMEDAPGVDAVEVVRCRECAWYDEDGRCVNSHCTKSYYGCHVPQQHFCSYGERRTDG